MPLSHCVLRRYTPPTCTLQIMAKSSPLSRWLGQSVLKDLQFELRFDDPRKPEDERVTIRGNAEDLEVLYDAVNSYVQDFLTLSAPQLPITLRTSTAATGAIPKEDVSHRATGVNPSTSIAAQSSEEVPDESDASSSVHPQELDPKVIPFKPRTPLAEIYLQPRGLFAHDLFLGRLATAQSGQTVDLSVLQLFDLATALDEYAAEGVALPNLNPLGWKQAPPAWASAAAVAILAVGVTTAGIRFLNQPNSKQEAAAPTTAQQPSPTPQPSLLSQVPLAPTTPLPTPLPTPVIPPPLATSPTLPPPTPVTVLPSSPRLSTAPGSQRPTLKIDSSTKIPALKSPFPELAPGGRVAILPRPASNPLVTSSQRSSTSTNSSLVSPASSQKSPAERTAPSALITPPPLPSLPSLDSLPSSPEVAQQVTPPSTTARNASASADLKPSGSTEAANAGNTTLFDNIPQVAEVRSYFQKRWQPPSGLTQTLEYSLTLNSDGTIQRIIPLGKAAGDFIDRTDIPLPGEPFVSPLDGGRNPSIRLVLTPDGKVSTFLEQTDRPQTQKK